MVTKKSVRPDRVANIAGVPSACPSANQPGPTLVTRQVTRPPPYTPPVSPPAVTSPPDIDIQNLPEVNNIRTEVLRADFARLRWDSVRLPGLSFKIWLDGKTIGAAVRAPTVDLSGLKPGHRYKVEIRTQPWSKMDRQAPSEKVTYYFTTLPSVTPPVTPPEGHIAQKRHTRGLWVVRERGRDTRSGYLYEAMTNMGSNASQFDFDIILRNRDGRTTKPTIRRGLSAPEGGIACAVPEWVEIPEGARLICIKWGKQEINGVKYVGGRSRGILLRPVKVPQQEITPPTPVTPTPKPIWYFDEETLSCNELATDKPTPRSARTFRNRGECTAALQRHMRETRTVKPKRELAIAKRKMRKVSARADELMKKRTFPKAVKEAIEKGLERMDAPQDIERMIEKVAKTNEPNYILRRTLAKRMGRGGIVQYKADTDKGTIIYENADEKDANAILGMPTPTGEVIPLQIKVIR